MHKKGNIICVQKGLAKLDLKGGLGWSTIRCLSAPLSPTIIVGPEVTPASQDYCNTDSHHFNIDSMGATGDFRGFFFRPFFGPFLGAFLKQKSRIMEDKMDLCVFQERIENSLVDIG